MKDRQRKRQHARRVHASRPSAARARERADEVARCPCGGAFAVQRAPDGGAVSVLCGRCGRTPTDMAAQHVADQHRAAEAAAAATPEYQAALGDWAGCGGFVPLPLGGLRPLNPGGLCRTCGRTLPAEDVAKASCPNTLTERNTRSRLARLLPGR